MYYVVERKDIGFFEAIIHITAFTAPSLRVKLRITTTLNAMAVHLLAHTRQASLDIIVLNMAIWHKNVKTRLCWQPSKDL